jgi:hypothetical protein
MTAQLEAMATAARLEMLAYFLGMAKAEAELVLRTSPDEPSEDEPADESSQDGYDAGGPQE